MKLGRLSATCLGVGFAAVALGLQRAGGELLATPPVHSWSATEAWYAAVGPATATMALLRCVAVLLAAWLAAATLLQVAASLSPGGALRLLADAVSPLRLRELGRSLATVSVAATMVLPSAAGAAAEPPPGEVAVMRPLDAGQDAEEPAPSGEPAPARRPAPVPRSGSTHLVAAGSSVWSIAEGEVAARLGRAPTDRETAALWLAMVELNLHQGRFRSGDADLIFPGDELLIPPP